MTHSKVFRAGLLALALGLLLGLFINIGFHDTAFAQTAEAAAAATPPACDATVVENCTPNSGDTAWMLTSVALVLMMAWSARRMWAIRS